jgi:hypothetical protein
MAMLAAKTYYRRDYNQEFLQEMNLSTFRQQYKFLLYENLKIRIESKKLIQEISENFKLFNFNDTHKNDNYDELLEKLNFFKDLCIDKLSELFNTD